MGNALLSLATQRHQLEQPADVLSKLNVQDMLETLGLERRGRISRLLEWICKPVVLPFSRQIAEFDRLVGKEGLSAGAEWLLNRYVSSLEVRGQQNIPRSGPVLITSNHPGLADTLALFASISRNDLRVVAADRPFLRALPNTSRHLFFVGSGSDESGTLRKIARHLRNGGAVLIFPAGEIEPDPSIAPVESRQLDGWSKSIGVIVRLATETRVVPAIVSGVVSRSAQRSFITHLRQSRRDRERLGAMLQILISAYRSVDARVTFGRPLELAGAGGDSAKISEAIAQHARLLLASAALR